MEQAPGRLRFSLPSTDDDLARVVEDYSATGKDAFDDAAPSLPVFGRDSPCVGQAIALRPWPEGYRLTDTWGIPSEDG